MIASIVQRTLDLRADASRECGSGSSSLAREAHRFNPRALGRGARSFDLLLKTAALFDCLLARLSGRSRGDLPAPIRNPELDFHRLQVLDRIGIENEPRAFAVFNCLRRRFRNYDSY